MSQNDTTTEIEVGTKVLYAGYNGTVSEVCDWNTNMVVVKLARGSVCVGKSDFDGRFENYKVIG